MGWGLSLEAATTAFSIAMWVLFASLVVGASAAVVMVFTGLVKGRRCEVLGTPSGQSLSGSPFDTGTPIPKSRTPYEDIVRPNGLIGQSQSEFRTGHGEAAAAPSANAATSGRAAETDHKVNETYPDRVSSEASLAPRTIDATGKLVLLSRLSRFKDTGLDVLVYSRNSADAFPLAAMLSESLETAGWNVRIWHTSTAESVRGLLVQTRRGSDQTVQDPGVKLMLALQEVGLAARGFQSFDSNDMSDNAAASAWKKDMMAPIRLLIGRRA
jgi:hypothetical protein